MITGTGRPIRWSAWLLAFALSCTPIPSYSQGIDRDTAAPQQPVDPEVARKLSLAYGYHELAVLYIRKGEPDKAVSEARRILNLGFPAEQEHLVAQSLGIIAEKLGDVGRFELAQALLDDANKTASLLSTRIKILKTKARLYRTSGENDKAIENMKRALELEGRPSP